MEGLKDYIRSKRKLSEGSITTYYYLLKSVWKNVYGDKPIHYDNFNSDEIYDYVKEHRPKTTIAALCVVTENPRMKKLMEEEVQKEKVKQLKQEKTEKQEENWLSADEIRTKFDELKKKVPSWYKTGDYQDIQQYILLAVAGGLFVNPRRSKDWFDFKIRDIDYEKDNYMVRDKVLMKGNELEFDPKGKKENVFVFNSYKGSDAKGQQLIIIPKELMKILKKWIESNPTPYLFYDKNNSPLTAVKINQRFEKMFGKQASVNHLRHTHLTDKFGSVNEIIKDVKQTMKQMGSGIGQFEVYVLK
jgi:integrase